MIQSPYATHLTRFGEIDPSNRRSRVPSHRTQTPKLTKAHVRHHRGYLLSCGVLPEKVDGICDQLLESIR